MSGGTERATSVNMATSASARMGNSVSREMEPVRRSFCGQGSCTFTEVARLVPSGDA